MQNKWHRITLLLSLLLTVIFLNSYSQDYKKIEEYKKELLQRNDKLNYLEGIWQFNVELENTLPDGFSRKSELAPFQVEIRKGISDDYFFTRDILVGMFISEKSPINMFTFQSTANNGRYLYNHSDINGEAIINSNGDLVFESRDRSDKTIKFNLFYTGVKIFPSLDDFKNHNSLNNKKEDKTKPAFSFGTGVLINKNSILTCYHVVKDSKEIQIHGIGGVFDSTFIAKISYFDEGLDIAILQFTTFSQNNLMLPISFKKNDIDVGDDIFVLGYPLQKTMGTEIKLTTGVISSNSGFLDNKALFQISAPIQPGNSGGPLFDKNGNIIGIVSAKHRGAENVGYAIKINQFDEVLKQYGVNFNTNSTIPIELSRKVKLLKDYIFPIEVSY